MKTGRLSTLSAAMVMARRDFTAILFGRSFIFFLLAPFFPVVIAVIAGSIGQKVQQSEVRPALGIVMAPADAAAMVGARTRLARQVDPGLPEVRVLRGAGGERVDIPTELKRSDVAAIVSGTLEKPVLTGTADRLAQWQGDVALIAGVALQPDAPAYPEVALDRTRTSNVDSSRSRAGTAQGAQTMLFLLTMILAGMVLSNLVEEK
ncbi:MAG: ABC transporter permease, partial [Novosphingobium sp.]